MRPLLAVLFLGSLLAAQPYPAPGKMVDAGGYRVHLNCTGEGSPAVVIVGGGFSFDWALVQSVIARSARVCTYDPAGTAWSDAAPSPDPSCSARVSEIHAALTNAPVKGPYLLVGLSIGALVARLYQQRYPDEVRGMVIVDHAFLDPVPEPDPNRIVVVPGLDSPPVLISKTPIVLTVEDISNFNNLPEHERQLHRWAMSLNPQMPTVETARACVAEVGAKTLRNLPLAVVSTGNNLPNYTKLQADLLALSSSSRQFMALKSIHAVQIDQPEVIDTAILQILDPLRTPPQF